MKTDVKFCSNFKRRRRIHHALNGKLKSSTKVILGISIDTYRMWIEYQFTPEMIWSKIEISQVRPISSFDVSNGEELKEALIRKTLTIVKKGTLANRN